MSYNLKVSETYFKLKWQKNDEKLLSFRTLSSINPIDLINFVGIKKYKKN